MELKDFLRQPTDVIADQSVVYFVHKEHYPLLFFASLLKKIDCLSHKITRLDVQQSAKQQVLAQLETSFLGTKQLFWVGNISMLSAKERQWWGDYLASYVGPNTILCSVSEQDISRKSNGRIISLPEKVTARMSRHLFTFLVGRLHSMDDRRLDELFMHTDFLELDAACLLIEYLQLLGQNTPVFLKKWLHRLVVPQASLFRLSQYLFAQQTVPFMRQWHQTKDYYPDQFWIAYWAEQFWRAMWYCHFMKQKKVAQAKKVGYRLPFSFLQKDYKRYDTDFLKQMHHACYVLDDTLKHGGDGIGLDLLLYRFLLKTA